jgi:hypothetical protein
MSIVNKHPAPWTPMRHGPECTAYDANGVLVCEIGDGEPDREDLQRLILAAPELLAHQLRCPVWLGDGMVCSTVHPTKSRDDMLMEWLVEGEALFARIHGAK